MIEVSNLTRTFGEKTAVSDLSFAVKEGITGFLGENGAGKTTTMKLLMGHLWPDQGTIRICGESVEAGKDLSGIRGRIGYLPAQDYLFDHLTGKENLEWISEIRTGDRGTWKDTGDFIAELGVESALSTPLASCSSGMRRKIAILGSLVGQPPILIWDEPHTHLDIAANLKMKAFLRSYASKGRAVLFSSHILEMVEGLCDEVIIIHQGQLKLQRPLSEIKGLETTYLELTR